MAEYLKTDYVDDELDTDVNENRVFDIVDENGTVIQSGVSFVDRTVYDKTGDDYGAQQVNEQNEQINNQKEQIDELADDLGNKSSASSVTGNDAFSKIANLYSAFSNALTALKNTTIAQVVGATGSTFTSVIQKLSTITSPGRNTSVKWQDNVLKIVEGNLGARGTCSDGTVRSVFELPAGWYGSHDGTRDLLGITDAKMKQLGWLIPSGNKAISDNGSYDVKANAKVSVSVPNSLSSGSLIGTSGGSYTYDPNSIYIVCAGSGSAGITCNIDVFFRGSYILKEAPDYLTTITVSGNTLVIGGSATWRKVYKVT